MEYAPLRSYGRRRGRKLRGQSSARVEALLPRLRVELPENGFLDIKALFPKPAPLRLEIGFGGGEHLLEQAERNRDAHFLGCEPYINGLAKLLSAIEAKQLTNIRLHDGDA